jgi:tRNA(Ser,Leu) C12 N-acetylase TAN1
MEWNVVLTIFPEGYRRAIRALRELGAVEHTRFHNVLVVRADDARVFLDRVEQMTLAEPALYDSISRVAPATRTFGFQSADDFLDQAKAVLADWLPLLRNRSFHVRLHRRGASDRRSSSEFEQILGEAVLSGLEQQGARGSVSFTDPDAVIAIDTVGDRAGLALWTREDLSRYKMLRPD